MPRFPDCKNKVKDLERHCLCSNSMNLPWLYPIMCGLIVSGNIEIRGILSEVFQGRLSLVAAPAPVVTPAAPAPAPAPAAPAPAASAAPSAAPAAGGKKKKGVPTERASPT